ncbi:MAG TPA: anion transporter [Stellaceae bacterium]|nr:anion transporter [Stellaceae bacterium]
MFIAALIFALTYLVVALGRLPFGRLDRTGAALIGASLMVATGTLSLEEAYRAIDFDTITLLLGMMIIVGNLRLSGFFGLATEMIARRAAQPLVLLAGIVAVAGVLSAFLVNDTVCLMMTPLVIDIARRLKCRPLPYLLGLAMASNIGSMATITGNPQNMIIASLSHIAYRDFAATLAPVALLGLCLALALIALGHRAEFRPGAPLPAMALKLRWNRPLLIVSLVATMAAIAGFFWGIAPPKVAIVVGALLLLHPIKPMRVYREIDWSLLLLFVGLFIVLAGAEKALLTPGLRHAVEGAGLDRVPVLTFIAAALSNLLSNVPAVLALAPFIRDLADPARAWLTLAMAATLAGNFTILGSVANLIVVERARREGIEIGFGAYFRIGAPLTLATLVLGAWWLA